MIMGGVDRLSELTDEMLVNNIMSRLNCTTKEVIRTTATISTRWKNLWTSLPHLIFTEATELADLHRYMSFIDNTLNQCPINLNLKKITLHIKYSSRVVSDFKLRAYSWIRYAISRNVEDVSLFFWDGVGKDQFSFDDEVFFNNACFNRVKLTLCLFNPPNGVISWERLECLCLFLVTLDEDIIEKILSGSPSLKSLELKACYGYSRIDITSKSVRKLVFSEYMPSLVTDLDEEEAKIDCVRINAPYLSSLIIENGLLLRELVLLNMSSLVEAHLNFYGTSREKEILRGLLKSLGHVEDIIFGDHCLKLLSLLEAVDDDDRVENVD